MNRSRMRISPPFAIVIYFYDLEKAHELKCFVPVLLPFLLTFALFNIFFLSRGTSTSHSSNAKPRHNQSQPPRKLSTAIFIKKKKASIPFHFDNHCVPIRVKTHSQHDWWEMKSRIQQEEDLSLVGRLGSEKIFDGVQFNFWNFHGP